MPCAAIRETGRRLSETVSIAMDLMICPITPEGNRIDLPHPRPAAW